MELNPLYDLSVIIVNYNTVDFLVGCLDSVASQSNVNAEVIVVDNASRDNSIEEISKNYPWVKLIASRQNLGFAGANNKALNACKGKYIYCLNPDTEVRPGAFQCMIEYMNSHPEVGLAGTRLVNPDESFQSSVEKQYPGERHAKRELEGLKGDIAWVMGASMIVRRDVIEALKGFDESFFLYGEDMDLCLRVRKAGSLIGYIHDAVVVHWGGQSERNSLPVEVWEKKFEAEFIFYRKHYTKRALQAIKRASLIQAYWRVLTIKLALPFHKDKEKLLNKLEKYKLVIVFIQRG